MRSPRNGSSTPVSPLDPGNAPDSGVEDNQSLETGPHQPTAWSKAIHRVQAAVRSYVPEEASLADELIADRRREALPTEGR
jgi:hypothetical protein